MQISALDESGKPVDWWFIYKVPQLIAGTNSDSATGYEYVYYDSTIDKKNGKVEKSPYLLNGDKGALNLTLDSVFKKPADSTGWMLYNDEMPTSAHGKDDGNLGHTKGVITFDTTTKTAYWLLRSWPKFADPKSSNDPTPKYGQTYLCLSLDIATASKIATQMSNHQEPQRYLCRAAKLAKIDPLFLLIQSLQPHPKGDSNVINLMTRDHLPFKVIAKNREWNKDFWNDLVGPTLNENMDVETWIRGFGRHSQNLRHQVHQSRPTWCTLGLAGDSRSCEMGNHITFRLGLHRGYQSHDFSKKAWWRDRSISKRNPVESSVKDEFGFGASRPQQNGSSQNYRSNSLGSRNSKESVESKSQGKRKLQVTKRREKHNFIQWEIGTDLRLYHSVT